MSKTKERTNILEAVNETKYSKLQEKAKVSVMKLLKRIRNEEPTKEELAELIVEFDERETLMELLDN